MGLTVVALGDAILNSSTFGQIRDLGPVFVWVGMRTKGTACVKGWSGSSALG